MTRISLKAFHKESGPIKMPEGTGPYGSLARLEGKLSERETCDGCEQEIKTIKKHIAALKKSGQNW
jgi:hypothetical protein